MRFQQLALAASLGLVAAQRPANTSICDYYTTALLKDNTPANQMTVLTLVVNTVVIGNYTTPNVGIAVPGILAKGTYNGTAVNLLPYFDGTLKSSNRGGSSGVSINFLDDGGAAPLMKNMPSNGNTTSNQYFLLTHLYEFFGDLLGCSGVGMTGFAAYSGHTGMYDVHKFMDLNPYQTGYFITQVGLAAASFGVTTDDVTAVGMALNKLFNYRCEPAAKVLPTAAVELQSICINDACPLALNSTCSAYSAAVQPALVNGTVITPPGSVANSTNSTSSTSKNGTSTSSGSGASGTSAGAISSIPASFMALVVGVVAFVLCLA